MNVMEDQVYEALGLNQLEEEIVQSPEGEMSLEQRRENAARRRREEQRAAIQQAVEETRLQDQRVLEGILMDAGLRNPADGTPVTSLEQYRAWKEAQETMPQDPQPHEARMAAQVEEELAQIRKLNPNIQTMRDLLTMPKAHEFYNLVKRGNSFLDAYRLANYEELTQQAVAAARQQAMNNARSKGHLIAAAQRGRGSATVPAEEMSLFRVFNPQASEAAIQNYYNKYQGGR